MTPRSLLIVADDLTGACDTAGAVAAHAGSVPVHLLPKRPTDWTFDARSVVAVDLDSRSAPVAHAVERTIAAVSAATGDVYLKIDSTLRGHVVDTVAAAAGAYRALHPTARVVVCPAFPAHLRLVVDRRVVVDGVALASSALDELAALPGVDVADARTDADLAAIAAGRDAPTLWVGSAGLAPHVARHVGEETPRSADALLPRSAAVAVIVGSTQAPTVAGAAALAARGDDRVRVLAGDPRPDEFVQHAARLAAAADGLVLTGGYTARRVLDRLGIDTIDVRGELEPGIPWAATTLASDGAPLTIVTKAGGFGDAGTLARLADRLLGAA